MTTQINDVNITSGTATTPSSSDNSTKLATTAWNLLGFAISLLANGYIKFPTWLGGLVVQWGRAASSVGPGNSASITFPLAFPNNCFVCIPHSPWTGYGSGGNSSLAQLVDGSLTTTGFEFAVANVNSLNGSAQPYFIAIGN